MKNFRFLLFSLIILLLFLYGCTNSDEENSNTSTDAKEIESNRNDSINVNDAKFSKKQDEETDVAEQESLYDINIYDDNSNTVLVNKFHGLSDNYIPHDLVTVEVPTILENPEVNQMRKEAADALKNMFAAAKEEEIYLYARSGYRSYQTQVHLFNSYANQHGEEAANKFSAKPGYSEHQTGLTMDVTSESVNFQLTEQFGDTKEGIWLRENAHHFGFIIRYPKDKELITGYKYEPWHIRYLGIDIATEIYEKDMTYEEFLAEKEIIHEVNS